MITYGKCKRPGCEGYYVDKYLDGRGMTLPVCFKCGRDPLEHKATKKERKEAKRATLRLSYGATRAIPREKLFSKNISIEMLMTRYPGTTYVGIAGRRFKERRKIRAAGGTVPDMRRGPKRR